MPEFEVFERLNARPARTPAVTVTVRATFNLNHPAYEALGKPDAVLLLYARAERMVAFRPAGKDQRDAYLVRPMGQSGRSWVVVAREFCAWAGIDLDATRRYPLTVDADGLGCVDLSVPGLVVSRARRLKA